MKTLFPFDWLVLPFVGLGVALLVWYGMSKTITPKLPTPAKTWDECKLYVLEPFAKRSEMDQGVVNFTLASLIRVGKGFAAAIILGVPLGFLLGLSAWFNRIFDLLIQILRPVSPLAWFPLGAVLFSSFKQDALEYAALFTITVCAMWPTVLNTAVGVKAIPQDYLNVAKVLKLSWGQTLWKVMLPAVLPYMFTGFRLSLGIAWLVIVAAEMLTGSPGIGSFLNQEYLAGHYSPIIFCIIVIGIVGFILDRLMNVVERRFKTA
jgi:nitrate/nitrite transport system permease protein